MKRILFTLIAIFASLTSFSQITFTGFRYQKTLDDAITIILKDNPNIGDYGTYDFNYKSGKIATTTFYVFSDKDGYFLDLVIFDKDRKENAQYRIYEYRKLFWDRKRKIIHFYNDPYDSNYYKFIMDDGTHISVTFDSTTSSGYWSYLVEDYVSDKKKVSGGTY